ncbi:MAG: hypothetical protein R2860_14695 [Desulfobacterales bacterium]
MLNGKLTNDEEAVEEYLKNLEKQSRCSRPWPADVRPSRSRHLRRKTINQLAELAGNTGDALQSALSHWPVQIRSIPPTAPFLKNADLLVLADCGAVAAANLHTELLPGKVVMMGCP